MVASSTALLASASLDLGSKLLGVQADAAVSRARTAYQQYSNTMVDLSVGMQEDNITLNEILYNKASAAQAAQIQESGMTALGEAEVSAAAAGVTGKSVQVSEAHIQGNAAAAEVQRQRDYKFAMLGFDAQRRNVALTGAMQKDYSNYASSSGTAILGAVLSSGSKLFSALGV